MSTPTGSATPRLLAALEAISDWREAQEEEAATQLAEVDAEEARLRTAIAELEKQIGALDGLRSEIRGRVTSLDREEIVQSHGALVDALNQDRELIERRSDLLQQAKEAATHRAEALLDDPDLADAVREFEGFQKMTATLSTLPPSYRKAIEDHHVAVKRRLQPLLDLIEGPVQKLDEPMEPVSIVASVEPMEGPPQALALVVPVAADVYNTWPEHDDDLCAQLAYRVVAAAAQMAAAVGAPDAPISYRPFEGSLVVQIWLGDHEVEGDLRELATGMLDVHDQAPAFASARLEFYALWLPPDVLSPPDDEDDEEEEG
jgi:hypothetical protein